MLRVRLQDITDNIDMDTHVAQIELARQTYSHTIEILPGANDNRRYNCVMFALGIETDRVYYDMARRCPDEVHADTNFVQFLVDRGFLVEQPSPKPGLLIAYLSEGRFRHIGKLTDRCRIQSKWGIGNLYEHATFEVPISYGDAIQFFLPIEHDPVLNAFIEFAKLRGVSFGGTDG